MRFGSGTASSFSPIHISAHLQPLEELLLYLAHKKKKNTAAVTFVSPAFLVGLKSTTIRGTVALKNYFLFLRRPPASRRVHHSPLDVGTSSSRMTTCIFKPGSSACRAHVGDTTIHADIITLHANKSSDVPQRLPIRLYSTDKGSWRVHHQYLLSGVGRREKSGASSREEAFRRGHGALYKYCRYHQIKKSCTVRSTLQRKSTHNYIVV